MKKVNICRCCLTSGCQKELSNDYKYDGKTENYGEILSKTFNLNIICLNMFICEACIVKIRDAATFKQQILNSATALSELISEGIQPGFSNTIKSDIDEEYSSETFFYEVKTEDESSVELESCNEGSTEIDLQIKTRIKENRKKSKKDELMCTKQVKKKSNPEKELQIQQRENSIKLISYSNICIFKSLRTRFACYICNEKFFDIKELRNHSKTHTIEDFMRRLRRLRGKSYENVDITNLTCQICTENCPDLDILRKHLTENHSISFGDANHIFIPFKLEEGFKCEVCKDSFNTFTRLAIHMNCHATSNICETCGMAFYNRISLRNHIRSIHKEQKCPECPLKFTTTTKLVCHKRRVHNAAPVKHYCLRCNMTFRFPYLLKSHMVEKHGDKYNIVECGICKKVFKDNKFLSTHTRSVHLNERNFQCTLCDLRFFTRTDRRRHEKTHSGGTMYSCSLCQAKFKCKDSVGRHMKRKHAGTK